jgi:acyl-CoA synthetase (AMP-forming)/AMP-acid ligase II
MSPYASLPIRSPSVVAPFVGHFTHSSRYLTQSSTGTGREGGSLIEALPTGTSWWHLISRRADLTPDERFLSDEAGRELTFGEYRTLAEEVAAGLDAIGIGSGDVVSWQLPTGLEAAVLMAALCRLNVRQNPIIPIYRRAEVSFVTEQVNSTFLIVPGVHRGFDYVTMAHAATSDSACTVIDASGFTNGGEANENENENENEIGLPRADPSTMPAVVDPGEDVRWYYFSSGTTATAKGAMHSDRSAMAASNAQIEFISPRHGDMLPMAFPISHIGGLMQLTAYMRAGAELMFIETWDPMNSPETMAQAGATILGSATPFFHAYLAAQHRHGDQPLFPKLREFHAGGAPITPELNAECLRVFGVPIFNQWGLTEFPSITSLTASDPPEKFDGTVGRVATGVELKIVGLEGELIEPGIAGELRVKGPQQLTGYTDSSLDADAFDQEGFFCTGDLGFIDHDGYVTITGRLKDIIIRNAENLSALEIENVLIEHPHIADVAVIGLPDLRTGERACAVVVPTVDGHDLSIEQLAAHCLSKDLARQKTPEQLELVDGLPRNPMGKVLKHVLRERFATKPEREPENS